MRRNAIAYTVAGHVIWNWFPVTLRLEPLRPISKLTSRLLLVDSESLRLITLSMRVLATFLTGFALYHFDRKHEFQIPKLSKRRALAYSRALAK